jgi:hypothetical protein
MMYTYMQFVSVCVAIIASIYGGVYIYLWLN